jgi:hypothetical protein
MMFHGEGGPLLPRRPVMAVRRTLGANHTTQSAHAPPVNRTGLWNEVDGKHRRLSVAVSLHPHSLSSVSLCGFHGQAPAPMVESTGLISSRPRGSRCTGAPIHELHAHTVSAAIPPGAVFVGGEIAANPGPLVSQRTRATRREVRSLTRGSHCTAA